MGDLKSFQARFIALRQALLLDGMKQKVPFHMKDLQTLSERIENEGTSFVKVTLPLLGKALDYGLVTGHFVCPANFRVKRNTCLPMLCGSVFKQIFKEEDGILLSNPNFISIFFLRQFLLLDSKLISEPTPDQKKVAVQGFIERQRLLREKKIYADHPVLSRARALLGRVLNRLDLSDISPRHGPGIVAERKDRFERWDFDYWPAKAEKHYPYLVYGTQSLRASLERGTGVPLRKVMETRCCLVPKDFKGPRLISAESSATQYLQQGQMLSVMDYIDKHPILSRSIKLRDQTQNQKMAQRAVRDNLVTLDLSNASDTVSTVLVWYLLADVPVLRSQLMSTRSDYMSHDGNRTKLVAFAPMGSAVCFPVETLVFWALTMASLMLARHQLSRQQSHSESSWRRYLIELSSSISIFGDDIIIPEDGLDILIGTLDSVGCSVNASKTCYRTPFRESCGTEWMNDTDVTIIRNRRYHYEDDKKFEHYPVLCDLQRKFFLRGLHHTAEVITSWAGEIWPTVRCSILHYPADPGLRGWIASNRVLSQRKWIRPGARGRGCVSANFSLERFSGNCDSGFESLVHDPYFAREGMPIDSFPFLLGWQDDASSASRCIRWNRDYQRIEFRVPRVFQPSVNWSTSGYHRLFARLSGDQIERIAIRDRKIKMAWSFLPFMVDLSIAHNR